MVKSLTKLPANVGLKNASEWEVLLAGLNPTFASLSRKEKEKVKANIVAANRNESNIDNCDRENKRNIKRQNRVTSFDEGSTKKRVKEESSAGEQATGPSRQRKRSTSRAGRAQSTASTARGKAAERVKKQMKEESSAGEQTTGTSRPRKRSSSRASRAQSTAQSRAQSEVPSVYTTEQVGEGVWRAKKKGRKAKHVT